MNLFDAIYTRRDVRNFKPDPVSETDLRIILDAAHHAGSVGFMQPWKFIVIKSQETKNKVFEVFLESQKKAQEEFTGTRKSLYKSLKLEGIRESPVNIAVTCHRDLKSMGPLGEPSGNASWKNSQIDQNPSKEIAVDTSHAVLGKHSMPEMDVYSTCCAIQNLWLAARALSLGVGWVSIIDPIKVKEILNIPKSVTLVGYLCLGYPQEFLAEPMLAKAGWRARLPLAKVVYEESWPEEDIMK